MSALVNVGLTVTPVGCKVSALVSIAPTVSAVGVTVSGEHGLSDSCGGAVSALGRWARQ